MANHTTLKQETDEARDQFLGSLPSETKQTVDQAFAKLLSSDIGQNAKNVGDIAPNIILENAAGQNTNLQDLLKKGPVVLNFFRGGWCPFCNLEFKALHDRLAEINALGASLIGISPEKPKVSLETNKKFELQFDVLCDVGNKVARDYGLLMTVDETLRPLYDDWGIDVPAANGDDTISSPVP